MNSKIKDILKTKGSQVWSVSPNDSVFRALEIMAEKEVGALVVLENNKIVGIFSERDYARKVILKGKASKSTTVKELMTSSVFCVTPETSVEECMALISEKRIRHLPVVENEKLVGMVTIGDTVKQTISDKDIHIKLLHDYIVSK